MQCIFNKPIIVEIQHCRAKRNLSKLKIVRAFSDEKSLPYKFKPLGGGFNADAFYGAIDDMKGFSGVGVIDENPDSERLYFNQLIYCSNQSQQRHNVEIHVVFTWNTGTHINYVSKTYPEQQGFIADCYQVVELDGNTIRVGLDQGKWTKLMDGQWEIHPKKAVVTKTELDDFKPDRGIPNCLLLARPLCEDFPYLLHLITLDGIKPPYNELTLSYEPIIREIKPNTSRE